jgi:DNA-binding beta-propeller fold protein YncE
MRNEGFATMSSPMIRAIAGVAALAIVCACGGTSGSPGAALPAMSPSLHRAAGSPALPQAGTLFVADYAGNDIAMFSTGLSGPRLGLSPKGTISKGVSQPRVLTTDAAGDLFVGNAGDDTIKEYRSGSATASVTIRNVYHPQGLAIDAHGNLWASQLEKADDLFPVVDEYAYNAADKTFATRPSKTIIGSGPASLVFPHGLAFDSSGNLFIADGGHSGALLEVKPGSTAPVLAPLPRVPQPANASGVSEGFPGFIVSPLSLAVSGSGTSEKFEVSDFATGSIAGVLLGDKKPAWYLLSFFNNVSWIARDGNGFSYAVAYTGGEGGQTYYLALIDPSGSIAEINGANQFQEAGSVGISVPEGIAFTTAGGSAVARTNTRGNVR